MTDRLNGELLPDPDVKGVARLLAPGGIERFVKDLKKQIPIEGSVILAVLKQRLGQRALIRVDGVHEGRRTTWYAKLFRRSQETNETRVDLMRRLSESAAAIGIQVPQPVATLERYRAIVLESASGTSLLPCCAPRDRSQVGRDSDRVELPATLGVLGRALAELHANLPSAGPRRLGDFEHEQIERASDRISRHRPDLIPRFGDALRDWARREPLAETEQTDLVTLHGDLYPAQVLVRADPGSGGPRFAILDWDAICTGEPERDIGNFEAHLQLEGVRGHLPSDDLEGFFRVLEAGYQARRPIHVPRLDWYRRGSLLRLAALYVDPNFGPHPPNPGRLAESLFRLAER